MYTKPKYSNTRAKVNQSKAGETIEQKIERIVNNKEMPKPGDGAPMIYTERKEGIRASTNIRTDRWEIAIEASDKIAASYKARREERGDGKPESLQGKGEPTPTAET